MQGSGIVVAVGCQRHLLGEGKEQTLATFKADGYGVAVSPDLSSGSQPLG